MWTCIFIPPGSVPGAALLGRLTALRFAPGGTARLSPTAAALLHSLASPGRTQFPHVLTSTPPLVGEKCPLVALAHSPLMARLGISSWANWPFVSLERVRTPCAQFFHWALGLLLLSYESSLYILGRDPYQALICKSLPHAPSCRFTSLMVSLEARRCDFADGQCVQLVLLLDPLVPLTPFLLRCRNGHTCTTVLPSRRKP